MIEIIRKDKKWIAFNGGGIMDYDDDLETLFNTLARRADEIQKEVLIGEAEEENPYLLEGEELERTEKHRIGGGQ